MAFSEGPISTGRGRERDTLTSRRILVKCQARVELPGWCLSVLDVVTYRIYCKKGLIYSTMYDSR